MKDLLISCYYDRMSLKEAISFVENSYGECPTERQINSAVKSIKDCTNIDWRKVVA
jgi:uncharacterized protein YpuA (DUF1002 family)